MAALMSRVPAARAASSAMRAMPPGDVVFIGCLPDVGKASAGTAVWPDGSALVVDGDVVGEVVVRFLLVLVDLVGGGLVVGEDIVEGADDGVELLGGGLDRDRGAAVALDLDQVAVGGFGQGELAEGLDLGVGHGGLRCDEADNGGPGGRLPVQRKKAARPGWGSSGRSVRPGPAGSVAGRRTRPE